MYIGLHVKYPLFVSDCNETRIFSTVFFFFEKCSLIKFHENLSSGSRVVPGGQTDGQPDMMKLTVALRYFANVPKNNNPKITRY